jgi:hypothetical protein
MGQQRWLDQHQRQSHIQNIGDRCPDTLGTLRSASFKGGTHGMVCSNTSIQTPCKPNATAHEPSRETLAAFACERSMAARLTQLPPGWGLFFVHPH